MSTVTLNAYTKAYPLITNRIKASVLSATSPFAVVASIIDTTLGHPARTYDFLGLPRNNYGFSLDEIDGSGNVVNNLALFSVVPGTVESILVRNDEQPRVGETNGFVQDTNTFTFDGTETSPGSGLFKPNYVGWEIVPSELNGRGILVRGKDYSWDSLIGKFDLLTPGDLFIYHTYFNIKFEPIQQASGNSYPTVTDFVINYLKVNTVLDESYFGKKLLVEPTGVYVEITLPDIATVVDGRKMMVEVIGSNVSCVKFIPHGSDNINWLNGNLYAMSQESFSIYKFTNPVTSTPEWRICDADGNFKNVGQSVSDEQIQSGVFNKLLLDGSSVLKEQYARLYNELVLNLPLSQVVDYDSHSVGNNKYLWSRANSANPANNGKFLIPDRRGLFEKNNQSGKAGDFGEESVGSHKHFTFIDSSETTNTFPAGASPSVQNETGGIGDFKYVIAGRVGTPTRGLTSDGGGTKTEPKNYLINKYVLV